MSCLWKVLSRMEEKTTQDWSREFGEWFDGQLKSRNITDADLSRRAGITRTMVGKYRRGVDRPSPRTCARIAEAFDMNPLDVMSLAGHGGVSNDLRERIADLVRFIPDERLPETERYLRFMANEPD